MHTRNVKLAGYLLLTASSLAITAGMAHAQVVTNPPTPFTNTGSINQLIFNDGAVHIGDVTNATVGQINFSSAAGSAAVLVANSTTITGNITNNGAITATQSGGPVSTLVGIDVSGGTVGNVVNAGNLTVTGPTDVNIGIKTGNNAGSVTNSGTLSVNGGVEPFGMVIGSQNTNVINSGTMNVTSTADPASPTGFSVVQGDRITNTATGTINVTAPLVGTNFATLFIANNLGKFQNDGTITVSGVNALGPTYLFNNQGGVVNNGTMTITAQASAAAITLVGIQNGTFANGITNNGTINVTGAAGPTILTPVLGGPSAIVLSSGLTGQPALPGGGTITGGITNNGIINVTSTSASAAGININPIVATGNSYSIDFIANNGTMNIKSAGTGSVGILLQDLVGASSTLTVGSVTNTGTINATTGILVGFATTITNGITNTGTVNAVTAINTTGDSGPTLINQNGGALNGAVAMSATNADVLNINGGTVNGQVTGSAATVNMTNGVLVVGTTTADSVGTFKQTAGTLSFNVTPNAAVHGSVASLNPSTRGGTFQVVEAAGLYAKSQTYNDVLIAPSASGSYIVSSISPAFSASLIPGSSGANESLLLTFNGFGSVTGLTPNERAAGRGIDALVAANPTGTAAAFAGLFATLSGTQLASALDFVSGEIHASTQTVLLNDSIFVRNGILDRLRQAAYTNAPGDLNALGFAGPALAYQGEPSFPVKAPRAAPAPDYGVTYWAQGVGARGTFDGDGNAASLSRRYDGFLTGIDARFADTWRIGLAGGASHASVNVDVRASSAAIDTATFALYAGGMLGGFNLRTGVAYSLSTVDTNRSIAFPGFIDRTIANYGAATSQAFGEIGYGMALGGAAIEPFGGLAWVNVRTDSFTEAGGPAALNGASNNENVGYSSLGVRIATAFALGNGAVLVPRAAAAWEHAFGDVNPTATLAFQGAAGSFGILGTPLARDAGVVEAGLDLRVTRNIKLGVAYFGEFASNVRDNAVKGMFTWNF